MKLRILAAASGIALSAFLLSSPAGAQGSYPAPGGDRVDANGMPTTHSTPQEKAQTADINNQAAAGGAQAQNQASANDAQYQAQQQQYQQQQQQYQDQMRNMRRSRSATRTARPCMKICAPVTPPSAPPIIVTCGPSAIGRRGA